MENPLASVPAEFVVSGTVRLHKNTVRVTVQLLERSSGITIFSEKYDRQAEDIFALQDEIVQSLAGCLPWRAIDALGRKVAAEKSPSLSSYQKFLKVNEMNVKCYLTRMLI